MVRVLALKNSPKCAFKVGSMLHSLIAVVASILILTLLGCSGGNTDPAQGGNEATNVLTPKGWELVWADEFSGSSLSSANWNHQTGDGTAEGIPGWGNNEQQYYQSSNVRVGGGHLVITAKNETVGNHKYTSGRINTDGKVGVKYGRIEARIQAAAGQGLWSAFWMLPTDSPYGGWAAGGEIDIMEVFSRTPGPFSQAAIHYGMAWPLNTFDYQKYEGFDPADGFHTYALEWDETELRWFIDGNHYYTVRRSTYWNYYKDKVTNAHTEGSDSAPFDQPFHLLLNVAVGGNLPGDPDPSVLPSEMRVDYVRIYKCNINEATGVGCAGFTDYTNPSVIPPLGNNVYVAEYNLYVDEAGPLTFPETEDEVPLSIGVWDNGGAAVLTHVDEGGDRGMVIDFNSSGGGNFNIFPTSTERQTLFGMGSASDGANYAGELKFDLYVFEDGTDPMSGIQVKLDSGFPDLGFVEVAVADLPKDQWTTVTVQISDIAHNPGMFGGKPVDLARVLSLFVLEPTGAAHLKVDNIQLRCGHVTKGFCGIRPPQPPPPPSAEPRSVYIDSVDPVWDLGILAADSGSGWANYSEPNNPANKVQWRELSDAERGEIIEVTFSDSDAFGVWFIQASMGVDLTEYASGTVNFDIKVDNYGANEDGMTMKIDCVFPCSSGDQLIGKVGDGKWETVEIPVSRLLGGGLNLSNVNTGIVVFPTSQTSTFTYQLDNIQWLAGDPPDMGGGGGGGSSTPVVLYDNALADGWVLWDCCGGGTFAEVEDDADHGNVVELKFGETPTVTGFQAAEGVDVSGLEGGDLVFDFKEVSPPPEGSVWRLKLESSNASSAKEVLLTDAGNPEPNNTWQTYRFSISEDLAGLDITDVTLVMMFPNWGQADGAVARIDNVRFVPAAAGPAVIFADTVADGWYLWDCCGAGMFNEVQDDADHGQVIELQFGAGGTVTGLNATAGVDASAYASGILEYEFKQVNPPPEGSEWRLKVESSDAATAVDIPMTAGGNPTPNDQWQTYQFGMDTDLAGLDVSNLKLILFFPLWEQAEGAVARIDNVVLKASK